MPAPGHSAELDRWLKITDSAETDNQRLLSDFIQACKRRGRASETLRHYAQFLAMYDAHLGGTSLLHATKVDMEDFVFRARLRKGKGTPASYKRDAAILRSFYRWAWEEGHTSDFLAKALHGPTVPPRTPRPIADDDWLKVWQRELSMSDRVMLGLGFYLGLRRQEIATIRPHMVTPEYIEHFVRKGGGEDRLKWRSVMTIYERRLPHLLEPNAFPDALLRLAESRSGNTWLLNYQGRGAAIERRIRKICFAAGVRFTPHQLRHSAATNMVRSGVPVALVRGVMNHSSINTTMLYVKAQSAELDGWLDSSASS